MQGSSQFTDHVSENDGVHIIQTLETKLSFLSMLQHFTYN